MRKFPLAFSLLAVLLTACASNNVHTRAGIVKDYGRLRPLPALGDPPVQTHVAVSFPRAPAPKLQIEPPQLVGDSSRLHALSTEERDFLVAHLARGLQAVPSGSGRPLRLISALTDVAKPSRALNVVTTALLGPISNGGATIEVSIQDAASGEEVAAMVCASEGRAMSSWSGFKNAYSPLGHAELAIDDCLQRLQKLLQQTNG